MSRSHRARGSLGGLKRTGASPERIEAAQVEIKYTTATDYIERLVDEAPALTELMRARLAAQLLGARREDEAA